MKIVCLDFETANRFKCSICAIGTAIIENRKIVKHDYWLIKPHEDYFFFEPVNVAIHGIDRNMVKSSFEFDTIYFQLEPLLINSLIIAHNAEFDVQALCETLDLYNIDYPKIKYLCTHHIALKTWIGLENYKLNTICEYLGYSFSYHNAENDAIACGKILLAALAEKNVSSIEELVSVLEIRYERLNTEKFSSL